MSRRETKLRHEHHGDTAGFLAWVNRATRGEFSVYHTGNLSADRLTDPVVDELACLVLLLHDTGWVNAIQCRQSVAYDMDYLAVRTGSGVLPRSIATRAITATDYRVLSGLMTYSQAPNAMSMQRAIRGILPTCSEGAAQALFKRLKDDGLVEPREGNRNNGWQISATGMMMLR